MVPKPMNDPYRVLGISRDATEEEVKKAYRAMARKYHPDNYINSPHAKLAEEKMKEINEAYEQIQRERADAPSGAHSNYEDVYDARKTYDRVRRLINNGNYGEADTLLEIFAMSDRGAEWNFLKGCVLLRRGYFYDAQKFFETACYLEPSNEEYRQALENIRAARQEHAERTGNSMGEMTDSCVSCCNSILCMNCCCNCLGGRSFYCC